MGMRPASSAGIRVIISGICLALSLFLSGCGSLEAPVTHEPDAPSQLEGQAEPVEPTAKATEQPTEPPTATPTVPPTATPTMPPTAIPTEPPTATPEPTSPPALSPIERLVAARNPERGAELFVTFQEAAGSGYSCSNCHLADSEKANLGPGLLNIKTRGSTRVEGMNAAEYIYNSIIDPKAYLVEGFDAELMPANWSEIYNDLQIFDIVAYLLTLEGESDIDDPEPAETDAEAADAQE